MDFLASTAIVIVGAVVFLPFVAVGFFGALATSPVWRFGVMAFGVVLLALVWWLASGRGDGQPAVVFGGRTGGSDELADTDGALGGLWLRSLLLHAGVGVVIAWLLVTLINVRNKKRET
jgi:hypothetical protein